MGRKITDIQELRASFICARMFQLFAGIYVCVCACLLLLLWSRLVCLFDVYLFRTTLL